MSEGRLAEQGAPNSNTKNRETITTKEMRENALQNYRQEMLSWMREKNSDPKSFGFSQQTNLLVGK